MTRIKGLDSIRLVCAMWVVASHITLPPLALRGNSYLSLFVESAYKCLVNGPAAVIVFFIISGFCIHYPNKDINTFHYGNFYLKRFARIVIPLFGAFLVAKIAQLPFSLLGNSILWSLIAEIIYYAIYPALLNFRRKTSWSVVLLISFLSSYCLVATNVFAKDYPSYGWQLNWLLGLPCWVLGCLLAENIKNQVNTSSLKIWSWRLLIWLTSTFILILRFKSPLGFPLTLNLFAVLSYFWLQREISYFSTHNPPSFMERAGKGSYSLYMVHPLVLPLLGRFTGLHLESQNNLSYWLIKVFLVLSLSFIFYILYTSRTAFSYSLEKHRKIIC